jgi:hypothetical protein
MIEHIGLLCKALGHLRFVEAYEFASTLVLSTYKSGNFIWFNLIGCQSKMETFQW